jgi:hypothetical protein
MLLLPLGLFLASRSRHSSFTETVIGIGVVLLVMGIAVWIAFWLEKRRAAAMRAAAEALGLRYHEGAQAISPKTIGHFFLGSQGHSRRVWNSMRGAAGDTEVTIFDYAYTVGTGKNQSTHSTTVVRFVGFGLGWPSFELRPEGIFSKIGAAFGGQDIDFESHPTFSSKFVLKAAIEAAVREFFDETLLSALEDKKKGFAAEVRGNEMLYYRPNKTCKPLELRALLEEAHGVYAQLADASRRRG